MRPTNEYLPTSPFGIMELHLLHLLGRHGSFTRVAAEVGLTQSAVTRQIQGVESKVGVALFERTTRKVTVTPAGQFLIDQTRHILGDVESALRRLREDFVEGPKQIRLGVSRSISLAYLPGFVFANQRRQPDLNLGVVHEASTTILRQLESDELDVGIICPPHRLPRNISVTHRFRDDFTLIVPRANAPVPGEKIRLPILKKTMADQSWLLISEGSNTGIQLRKWMRAQGWINRSSHEMDNFDLIINLVALGLGSSFVPQRSLALYSRRRQVRRVSLPVRFSREIVVLARKSRSSAPHLARFIENILF
jgi:DNA-binding transcriptional LysR family regulator